MSKEEETKKQMEDELRMLEMQFNQMGNSETETTSMSSKQQKQDEEEEEKVEESKREGRQLQLA